MTTPLPSASIYSTSLHVDEMVDGKLRAVLICFDLKILN
jgi:hypothetical protein